MVNSIMRRITRRCSGRASRAAERQNRYAGRMLEMRWARRLRNSVYRRWYFLSMYSGLRAFRNRASSRALSLDSKLEALSGASISSEDLGEWALHIHPRVRPSTASESRRFGLFSLQQLSPHVGGLVYSFFCSTSHFGRGHVEIAFFEKEGEVTYYGIRNIASANAHRLGLKELSSRFRLSRSGEDELVLRFVSQALEENGFAVKHATAHDCIKFTVDNRLLPHGDEEKVRNLLHQKYQKLYLVINNASA